MPRRKTDPLSWKRRDEQTTLTLNEERLANKIITLAVDIKKRVPNVAVSGIVFRADLQMEHKIRR